MSNVPIVKSGQVGTNLATAQAANAVSNVGVRPYIGGQQQGAMLRIVTATGTACSYLFEGSGDGASFYPLPWINVVSGALAATAQNSGLYVTGAAPLTVWFYFPVDIPWSYFRVTSSGQTGGMLNTYDIWSF